MQSENRLSDDLAKIATSALGTLKGARDEMESRLKDQLERIVRGMDLVRREEFEVVRAMASKARAENEALAKRVAALEPRRKAKTRGKAKPSASAKPAAAKRKPAKAARAKPAAAKRKATKAAPRAKKRTARTRAKR